MPFTHAVSSGILAVSLATVVAAPAQEGSSAIHGRAITSEGGPVRSDMVVAVTSVDGGVSFGAPVEADGTFRVEQLSPGRYVVSVGPVGGPLVAPRQAPRADSLWSRLVQETVRSCW